LFGVSFSDGNGRIGRLWQSVILYHWKKVFSVMPIESMVRDNQDGYYQAIEQSSAIGESTPFIEFILSIILKTVKNQTAKSNLKSNQEILKIIRNNNKITIKELSLKLQLSESGIKKIIKTLKEQEKLKRVGALKGGHWEIT
jgi:Fic family protein